MSQPHLTLDDLKAQAHQMKAAARDRLEPLSHKAALNLVARKHGYRNYEAARAMLERTAPPAPTPEAALPADLMELARELAPELTATRWHRTTIPALKAALECRGHPVTREQAEQVAAALVDEGLWIFFPGCLLAVFGRPDDDGRPAFHGGGLFHLEV